MCRLPGLPTSLLHLFIVPRFYLAPVEWPFSAGPGANVGPLPLFFHDAEQWHAIVQRLKLTPCPHCHAVGYLIRHGALHGFDDTSPKRKTLRARRLFCCNRHLRRGCGRTFSVWLADKIRRLNLTAAALGTFLKRVLTSSLRAACRAAGFLGERTWQRHWKRFDLGQCRIRTALLSQCPPPEGAPAAIRPLAAQILAHLHAAFPNADCPIAAFQMTLNAFFL